MDEDYVNNSHTQINVPPRDDRTPNNLSQPVCQNCSYPFDACDCVELEKFAKDLSKIISKKSNDDSEGKLQSIICDNCKEYEPVCACLRNICVVCGAPVGNITFTVCDECWDGRENQTNLF